IPLKQLEYQRGDELAQHDRLLVDDLLDQLIGEGRDLRHVVGQRLVANRLGKTLDLRRRRRADVAADRIDEAIHIRHGNLEVGIWNLENGITRVWNAVTGSSGPG